MEDRRSNCPISCTLELLGDKWTLLVIRDLFLGKKRFDEFLDSPEGISTNILTERLRRLEDGGLLEKEPYGTHPGRMAYFLTAKGKSLLPVIRAVRDWGLENVSGTTADPARVRRGK